MPTPAEYEEGLTHAANELRFLANRGIDHAMQSAWNTMRAYDDDEIWDE